MSAPGTGSDGPTLGPPFPWSNVDAVRYEVAVDTIGMVMAEYSARIGEQERSAAPDHDRIQHWIQLQNRCAAARRALRPGDTEGIAQIIEEYGALLPELRSSP
jgi:hypothetical protein